MKLNNNISLKERLNKAGIACKEKKFDILFRWDDLYFEAEAQLEKWFAKIKEQHTSKPQSTRFAPVSREQEKETIILTFAFFVNVDGKDVPLRLNYHKSMKGVCVYKEYAYDVYLYSLLKTRTEISAEVRKAVLDAAFAGYSEEDMTDLDNVFKDCVEEAFCSVIENCKRPDIYRLVKSINAKLEQEDTVISKYVQTVKDDCCVHHPCDHILLNDYVKYVVEIRQPSLRHAR